MSSALLSEGFDPNWGSAYLSLPSSSEHTTCQSAMTTRPKCCIKKKAIRRVGAATLELQLKANHNLKLLNHSQAILFGKKKQLATLQATKKKIMSHDIMCDLIRVAFLLH